MRTLVTLAIAALGAFGAGLAGATPPIEGDLLVTDSIANRLLRVRPSTGEVVQVGPAGQFSTPGGVTSTSDGGIYVTNLASGTVSTVSPETGAATGLPLTSGGGATSLSVPFGIDSDASGALYVYDTQPGRIVRLVPTAGASWEVEAFAATVPTFGRGLSLTKDAAGNAVDAFFASITAPGVGLWHLRVATEEAALIPDTPIGVQTDLYGVAAVGDCTQLFCTIAFTEFDSATAGDCPCSQARLGAFAVFAIIGGVATLYEFPDGRCPLGVAAASGSEFYVGTVANACTGAGARIERVYDTGSGFASEVVADLPPYGGLVGTRPTAVAIVPEPAAGGLALAAWTALATLAQRRSARTLRRS
jgi:hypothetical protein